MSKVSQETKDKIAAHQKQLVASGKHWTQTPKGRKQMAENARRLAKLRKQSQNAHWTQTPDGRKRMAKIAKKGRAVFLKKMASGQIKSWTQTPEGRARLSQMDRANMQNGRPDITDTTCAKIAERMANRGNAEVIGREYGVSGNTVRAWAKKYGHAASRAKSEAVPWGAHRTDVPAQTRELIAKRYLSGKENSPALAREFGISTTTVHAWAKKYGGGARLAPSSNGIRPSNRARSIGMQACGSCRTCLLCQKLGAEPQWIMCLVANPLEGGVV